MSVLPFPQRGKLRRMLEQHAPTPSAVPAGADDWASLMKAAQDGDRAAYASLLTSIVPYVRAIARRHGMGDDLEDAVQDVLLAVHTVRHTFDPAHPFKPWLATIASRRCIDLARVHGRRGRHEVVEADAPEATDLGSDPQAQVVMEIEARRLRSAVRRLPRGQRQAVELLKFEERSLKDAAQASRQSVAALKVACHRAVNSLRRQLRADEEIHHD